MLDVCWQGGGGPHWLCYSLQIEEELLHRFVDLVALQRPLAAVAALVDSQQAAVLELERAELRVRTDQGLGWLHQENAVGRQTLVLREYPPDETLPMWSGLLIP